MINKEEIMQLTEAYGGVWGIKHTERLLDLISIIGKNQEYDREIVWLSAYLHDWGGYAKWRKEGVDHAVRSKKVAEKYLTESGYDQEKLNKVLECIELRHSPEKGDSIEAHLISDADALDFLGCVGILRMFSMKPRDLRAAYETAKKRREQLPEKLVLERSREIALERLKKMDKLLTWFEQETSNYF
jgi:HD superfamily phosphodiesterase